MEFVTLLMSQAPAAEAPLGAIVALGVFVLLIALFVVAWVRKNRRAARGDAEQAPKRAAERAAEVEEEEEEEEEEAPPEPPPAKPTRAPAGPPEPARTPERRLEVVPPAAEAVEAPKRALPELGEARSLREGLEKTHAEGFVSRLGSLFRGKQLDTSMLEQVEEVMFTSDVGVRTSNALIDGMREELSRKQLRDETAVWSYLQNRTRAMLDEASSAHPPVPVEGEGPRVIMVIGVNGTGKTTTIGKLSARFASQGEKVLLAAGDTFRAAAVEQLEIWARRVGVDVHSGKDKADPAAVVFDAVERGKAEGYSLVIVDTAGRLHTQVNLMEELKKVHRVIGKARQGAPHEVLLVLDGTMGQNAIQQAQLFRDAVAVSGIVLTKLDGTAKGGVIIGICDQLKIPIRWVGVGERVQDLRVFDSSEFVEALFR